VSDLVIRIPGEPFAQPRARAAVVAGRAIIYDPKAAKTWKNQAREVMLHMTGLPGTLPGTGRPGAFGLAAQPTSGPVVLRVTAVFTCPKSDHRKREPLGRRWHTKKPDADNVLKAVKDAAKGVLWLDDSQVALETCTKIIAAQGEAPYILLRVRELHPDEIPRKETT
jgi:Holliday junction resolvase RusA-like endonuclease